MAEANQVEVENKVKDEEITFHENVWYKSITLIVNIVINLFIFLTLYICLMYVPSTDITISDLHIVLCVLGVRKTISFFSDISLYFI